MPNFRYQFVASNIFSNDIILSYRNSIMSIHKTEFQITPTLISKPNQESIESQGSQTWSSQSHLIEPVKLVTVFYVAEHIVSSIVRFVNTLTERITFAACMLTCISPQLLKPHLWHRNQQVPFNNPQLSLKSNLGLIFSLSPIEELLIPPKKP